MMRERKIPAQPGLPFKLNRNFPVLDALHVRIAGLSGKDMTLRPSPAAQDAKIKCLVNSFDASGGNTSLVIEEPPERPRKADHPLSCHVVTLSARTHASLQGNQRRLLDYLNRHPHIKLADLAYTTTARRMHENLRVAYTAGSTKDIISSLREDVPKKLSKTKPQTSGVIFAFTGQGSQFAGMGKRLYQHSSIMRDLLHTYQQMAEHQGGPSFLHLILDDTSDVANASTVCVQLVIVALEIATAQLLKMWGVKPDMVVGHSLGEYSALCVAEVLSVSDALFLVAQRAALMETHLSAGQYAMLAVGKDLDTMRQFLAADGKAILHNTGIACINAPQTTVISGPVSEIGDGKARLEREGTRTTVLRVPYGFHSQHIEPILNDFEAIAKGVMFSAPAIPVASTLLGAVAERGQHNVFTPAYLVRQAREPVNFTGALQAYQKHTLATLRTVFIEIGPEPVCLGLVRRTLNIPADRLLPTMTTTQDNWRTISSALAALYQAGASIDWPQYHKEFQSSVSLLTLPSYAFDAKDFWTPFVERVKPGTAVSLDAQNALSKRPSAPATPTFSTTSLQRVETEETNAKNISVTFASFTSETSLQKAIKGHVVNGLTICSLSIFCDMAKSAAQYAYEKLKRISKTPSMSVYGMNMTHALVLSESDSAQVVKTRVSLDHSDGIADIRFFSITGGVITEHGSCKVCFEDTTAWFTQLSQTFFLVKSRVQALKDMSASGKAHRLLKPVIYKLFDNLVRYSKEYQGLEEVWVDAQCHDAVGTVKLPDSNGIGNFLHSPFWIDASIHLAGFLLNASLKYGDDIACLSTGFESWRLLEDLQADEMYTTYVNMQETETPNVLCGAAYVYNSQHKLVQVTTGIRFQKMKKVVLNSVLLPGTSTATATRSEKAVAWPKEPSSGETTTSFSTGTSTPASQCVNVSPNLGAEDSAGAVTPASSVGNSRSENLLATLLYVVASESGCSVTDLDPETAFADLGMDSLMAITIIAVFNRDTGVELPATFFLDHPTVAQANDSLHRIEVVVSVPQSSVKAQEDLTAATVINSQVLPTQETPEGQLSAGEGQARHPTSVESSFAAATEVAKPSKVVLLHGSPSSMEHKLFLFPDGSGSPSRYIQLPTLANDINVFGLESPFLRTPTEYQCSVEAICDSFITAMKTTQPAGPYLLGGYSLGAIYAYETARQLLSSNEQVDGLFIIDMAVPKTVDAPISPSQQELINAGLLPSNSRLTTAQKTHLSSTIQAMTSYHPGSCPPGQRPRKTVLISSRFGLAASKELKLSEWAKGCALASRGWEELVGRVEVREIDAEHFSLFRNPAVSDA